MNPTQKYIKIQLGAGDRAKDVLQILQDLQESNVLFSAQGDCPIITESSFLREVKKIAKSKNKKIVFATRKTYFKDLLTKEKFTVYDKMPDTYAELPARKISEFLGTVAAKKNTAKKSESSIAFAPKSKGELPKFTTHKIDPYPTQRPVRGFFFFLFLFLILLLVFVFFWISPSAEIVLKPRINSVPITQNIVIALPDADIPDEEQNLPIVSGIFVQNKIQGSETFTTLDRKYQLTNATGEVTLFNETAKPKFLVPSRLASPEGYIFRFTEEVTIPPRSGDEPGRLVVSVVADEYDEKDRPIGELGNIDAGTDLIFPALRKELQELYYAKANRGPLVGGSTLVQYFMGEEDIEKAKPVLIDTFRIRAKAGLETELQQRSNREGTEYILVSHPDLLPYDLIDFVAPEEQVGEERRTFELSGELILYGLVFDRRQVVDLLREKLKENQDQKKKLLRLDPTSFEYRILKIEEFEEGKWVKLSVSIQGVETLDIEAENTIALEWRDGLAQEILGKPVKEARGIITNHPEIDEVLDIKISPFWIDVMPRFQDQIEFRAKN